MPSYACSTRKIREYVRDLMDPPGMPTALALNPYIRSSIGFVYRPPLRRNRNVMGRLIEVCASMNPLRRFPVMVLEFEEGGRRRTHKFYTGNVEQYDDFNVSRDGKIEPFPREIPA
jgi:hypothetical protein